MRRANEVMDRMQREDRAGWQDYGSGLRAFEAGTASDGLATAASDWPEYNDPEGETSALPGR
jgi:hypothetical protein